MNQRWREGVHSFRMDRIDPSRYDIAEIPDDKAATGFRRQPPLLKVVSGGPATVRALRPRHLVGVAVYSQPCSQGVLSKYFADPAWALELGRFVLLDEVPGNGESWFLARTFELLRAQGFVGVVSFSDPVPRTTADGRPVFPGHWGCIYQSCNAVKSGRSTARRLSLLPDGRVLSDRAISKIRARERGWEYAAQILVDHGADPLGVGDAAAWLKKWLPLTRTLAHPGNHRYLFGLDRRTKKTLPRSEPYPKGLAA